MLGDTPYRMSNVRDIVLPESLGGLTGLRSERLQHLQLLVVGKQVVGEAVVIVIVVLLDQVDVGDKSLTELEEDPLLVGPASVLLQLLAQGVDGGAYFECRAQLDLHGRH